jgi:hypothetical protein
MWKNQRMSMHQWGTSKSVHPKGGRGVTNCVHQVDVYLGSGRQGEETREVLRHPQRICQHGRGQKRAHGAARRTSRDDVHIVPQIYCKYITVNRKGSPVLYVKLQKALYGLMRVSLLFYRKLRKELEEYGFVVNPYDPCVANKDVGDGKQLSIIWHVDDLMALCKLDLQSYPVIRQGSMDLS